MELKKSDKANLDKNRGLFIEIGLLIALGFVFLAFEWKVAPKVEEKEEGPAVAAIEEEIVPITRQDEPPPPPPEPPKVTDILDIVADDVQVDNNIDINIEADQTTEITPVVFTETVVEEEEEEQVFTIVEDMPLFNGKVAEEGFREYVGKNTDYPPVAQENGISGRVFVEFTINQKGELVDAKITRGVDPLLDAEALRVIRSSPKWTPGKQRGKTVKVKYTFPVVFKLNN
jgi:protein TonB